jgi:hypothetical protein
MHAWPARSQIDSKCHSPDDGGKSKKNRTIKYTAHKRV